MTIEELLDLIWEIQFKNPMYTPVMKISDTSFNKLENIKIVTDPTSRERIIIFCFKEE